MPTLSKKLPDLRQHKSTRQYCVTINGHCKYLGLDRRKAKQQHKAICDAWVASGRSKAFDPRQPLSDAPQATLEALTANPDLRVVEALAQYLGFAKSYYQSDFTAVRLIVQLTCRMFGRLPINQFGPMRFQEVRDALVASGVSRNYTNGQMQRLKRAFRWCSERELCSPSVYHGVACVANLKAGRSAARETEPIGPVDDTTVEASLPFCTPPVAGMIRLQRLTGMRPGEVVTLRPSDLDRSSDVWRYVPPKHKTRYLGKRRVIYVGPQAQAVLAPFLTRPDDAYCFAPREAQPNHTRHKRRPRCQPGEKYSVASYGHAITLAAKKAGVASWHPNQLRHTRATEVRQQFGLEAAQIALGHSRASITEVYAERDSRLGVEVSKQIG